MYEYVSASRNYRQYKGFTVQQKDLFVGVKELQMITDLYTRLSTWLTGRAHTRLLARLYTRLGTGNSSRLLARLITRLHGRTYARLQEIQKCEGETHVYL